MKKAITILLLFLGTQTWGQIDTLNPLTSKEIADSVYGNLNPYIPTGKLYNRLLFEDTTYSVVWNIDSIGNSWLNTPATADFLYGALYELKSMSIDASTVPSSIEIYDPVGEYIGETEFDLDKYYFPIGIVDFDYNAIDVDENIQQGRLSETDHVLQVITSPLVNTKQVSLIAPLFDYFDSDDMGIVFKQENFYSNKKAVNDIVSIEIQHGTVTQTLLWDEVYEFSPVVDSTQKFKVTVTYDDQTFIESYFVINTPELYFKQSLKSNSFPGCTSLYLDGSEEINQDGNSLRWCWIPRCGSDGRLFKPYILLTGYRPPIIGQSFKKTWKLYNDDHQSLLFSLIDNNYDVLIVKFNIHAKPYTHGMENSADLLAEFLEKINVKKGGLLSGQENIIQGSSMSGDIARLALLRMEKKHLEDNSYAHHHSRLFIAYDANFYGANLPLAYQNQVYSHFKYPANSLLGMPGYLSAKYLLSTYLFATMQQKVVKELLMYHATAYDDNLFGSAYYQTSYTPTHHWRRQGYYNALDEVDNNVHIFPMPIACRNIAISLGKISETNNTNEQGNIHFNGAGQYWRDIDLGLWKFKLRASIYTSGNEYTELFWRKKIGISWNSLYVNHRVHVKNMQEIDLASGSYLDGTANLISVGNWTYFTLLNIFDGRDYFTHKPVVTALGINKTLWPSNGSMTLNMKDLGLMYNNYTDLSNNVKSDYYGYPNLGRPTDHFNVTPFEAIYVDNMINPHIKLEEDNGTNLSQLTNFILNEVEPWYLGLQNTQLGSKARSNYEYFSYRRAKHLIVVGHLVTPTTDPGDYIVEQNGKLTLKSAVIQLKTGVHFKSGSLIHIVPEYEVCSNSKSLNASNEEHGADENYESLIFSIQEKINDVEVFPNPASDMLYIKSTDNENIIELFIYDLTGTLLLHKFDETPLMEVNTDSLRSGTYLIHVKTESGSFSKKIVKS